jgi:hypothetical protein
VTLNNLLEQLTFAARYDEARAVLAEARQLMVTIDDRRAGANLATVAARLELLDGTPESFAAAARAALERARAENNPHLVLEIEEMQHRDRAGRGGIVAQLGEVDRLAAAYRGLDEGRKAALLRIATARALLAMGERWRAAAQLADVMAGEGKTLLAALAPDLASGDPPGS